MSKGKRSRLSTITQTATGREKAAFSVSTLDDQQNIVLSLEQSQKITVLKSREPDQA